jgi:hypothetical protein
MKPRIRRDTRVFKGRTWLGWACGGGGVIGFGMSPRVAFVNWRFELSQVTRA